jgi:enterochelin esterase-like enzyme
LKKTKLQGAHGSRLAIRELERLDTPTATDLDAFIAKHNFPLVEGTSVTFVYRGQANAVNLRHWIFGLPSSQSFHQLPQTDLWYLTMELPEGSRIEYKFEVIRGKRGKWIEDPLNGNRALDPFGANSVCLCEGYRIPEWTQHDPLARPGTLVQRQFWSDAYGAQKSVTLYTPARFRKNGRYPLLLVHDGSDYLKYAGLKTVLDNLIHRLEIPSMMVALLDPDNRLEEYANHDAQARFLTEELVPALEQEFPLVGDRANRGLMGASFGAVASFSTALHKPDFFGRLLLQSGSFAFSDIGEHDRGPVFDPVADFINAYRDEPVPIATKVFISCGTYESLIYENRSLIPLLQSTGMEVKYIEARDGHNWENWRDRLREGLSWLFPGPLWMVYE